MCLGCFPEQETRTNPCLGLKPLSLVLLTAPNPFLHTNSGTFKSDVQVIVRFHPFPPPSISLPLSPSLRCEHVWMRIYVLMYMPLFCKQTHVCRPAVHLGQGAREGDKDRAGSAGSRRQEADHPDPGRVLPPIPRCHAILLHLRTVPQ
jgi:hypothetical protein